VDDASIIAPDSWCGKSRYIQKQHNCSNKILILPPYKQFFCTDNRVEIAFISSEVYIRSGVRFLLEDMKDMILHIYKNHHELYNAFAKSFDMIIFSATNTKDVSAIYSTVVRLRLTGCKTSIVAIADSDIKVEVEKIATRYSGIKVLDSREKLAILKQEMINSLSENIENDEVRCFPATLTQRQANILLMAAEGISTEAIALHSGVTTSTIYAIKACALDKAGATSKPLEAILYNQIRNQKLHKTLKHHSGVHRVTT